MYYAEGNAVFKAPVETKQADGRSSYTLGFLVCECSEFVDGAAEEIAAALNFKAEADAAKGDA